MRPKKKDIPRIHIGMDFLQKTGSKLVNFCLSGPIYILPPPIGGRHPVPCLGTQISERDMVQQCTSAVSTFSHVNVKCNVNVKYLVSVKSHVNVKCHWMSWHIKCQTPNVKCIMPNQKIFWDLSRSCEISVDWYLNRFCEILWDLNTYSDISTIIIRLCRLG